MSWYILVVINVLAISAGTLFQKLSMVKEDSDPAAASVIFQFLLGLITLLYALVHGLSFPQMSLLPFFLISGVLYAIGTISYFNAYKYIAASKAKVLSGAGVIVTVIASTIFLRDKLALMQLLGILLILFSIVIVNFNKSRFKLNTGAWLIFLGTAAYGLAVVVDSYIVRRYDAVSYLPLACFVPGLMLYARYIRRSKIIFNAIRHIDKNLVIFTVLYSVQAIAFYLALQWGALVAQISAISRASIILTVILATVFLNERKQLLQKIIAAILTTVGILLVTG